MTTLVTGPEARTSRRHGGTTTTTSRRRRTRAAWALALAGALALTGSAAGAAAPAHRPVPPTPTPPLTEPLPAPAGELVEVTDFGPNPTDLDMHLYVPENVSRHPEVLVALHYCTGSGPAMFSGTDYASLADVYGFVVIYPTATREGHCYDVSSPEGLTGGSDARGVVSMVRHVQRELGADRKRVYATGISSGGMMTSVLLGAYPDVFAAGSVMSGVPYGCFATTDGSSWNSDCAQGLVDRTPQEWARLVTAADPGYRGPRPRVQLWHGSADETLSFVNFREGVEQWTAVHRTDLRPERVDHPRESWVHSVYAGRSGRVVVDAYELTDAPHAIALWEPWLEQLTIEFFGLTRPGGRP